MWLSAATLVVLLTVGLAAIVTVLLAPRAVSAWMLVAIYLAWPAVWLVVKPILMAPGNLFMPATPLGRVFPDPQLLGTGLSAGRLHRVKARVTRALASFVEIGLWPAAGLAGRTLHTVGTGSARVRYPRLGVYAVMSALLAIALVFLRSWAGTSAAVTVAALGLLSTITARHLLWLLSGEDFRLLLKRSLPEPYVALVVLAVFDYIALVAIAVVLRWKTGDHLELDKAVAEGRDLLELRHLTKLPQQPGLSPEIVCLAVAAAAYWASLAGQLIKVTSFRRSYDDRAWLAALTLQEGSVEEAEKLLEPVPRQHLSGPVLQMRIRLAIARSDLATAHSLARALDNQLDPENASEDGAIVYLATQMSTTRVESDAAWSLIALACAASIGDGAMFAALRQLGVNGVARTEDWEARAKAAALTPERYPMGWSWLQGSNGSMEEAMETLEAAKPANDADAVVRRVAIQAARDRQRWDTSREETEQELEETLQVLSAMEIAPLWLREFLVETTWPLERRAARHGIPRGKELRAIRRSLVPLPEAAAEAVLDDFDTTELARLRASRTTFDVMLGDVEP